MTAVTIHMPEELLIKVRAIAQSENGDLDSLINDVLAQAVRHIEARARFGELAARGRGREEEALELLRR